MGKGSYYLVLFMFVVDLLLLVRFAQRFVTMSFVKEAVAIMVLLVIAVISLVMLSYHKDNGWIAGGVFFAGAMVNIAYALYQGYLGILPIAIALFSAICFVFCTAMVGAFGHMIRQTPTAEQRVEAELTKEAAALENAEKQFDAAVKVKNKRRK